MKCGLICRSDKTGLGAQTQRLCRLLQPHKIMLIDSFSFNGNDQYPTIYEKFNVDIIRGFPSDDSIRTFLDRLDIVISCELFYSNNFTRIAREMNVKTILISNPEFFDYFRPEFRDIPLPDKVIVPTTWMMDKMKPFGAEILPTPIFDDEFKQARETNLKRSGKPRYLFVNGKSAIHDRNGLESLYEALALSKGDYEIVIKAQHDIKKHPDPRITYDFSNPEEQWKLYENFNALILPRRYAGQSLPMCEALMSGLPVIMTDISPNNDYLPKEWLIKSAHIGKFMTRTMVDIYAADEISLAKKLDTLDASRKAKERAYQIGLQFEAETLRPEYEKLLKSITN